MGEAEPRVGSALSVPLLAAPMAECHDLRQPLDSVAGIARFSAASQSANGPAFIAQINAATQNLEKSIDRELPTP
jgi:hypothetical protein